MDVCVGLVVVAILLFCVYMYTEQSRHGGSPSLYTTAFRSSTDENKRKYRSSRGVYEDNLSTPAQDAVTKPPRRQGAEEFAPFDAGMVNTWRKKPVAAEVDPDSPFTWQAKEDDCSVASLAAPSKEGAMRGANLSPDRNAVVSSDRARARIIGANPLAALRPRSVTRVDPSSPIVFNDSGMRQEFINEQGGGCFDKGDNLEGCSFDRCKN